MTLPASGTISLNDIRVELQQASTNVSLGALSNLAGFVDPDAVSEFYGFSYEPYNTFEIHNDPYVDGSEACLFGADDNLMLFFAGSGGTPACPTTGVRLFTNAALTTPFDGQDSYWKSNQCNASYYIINPDDGGGLIEGITAC
jgi:hypothetical protein